MTATNNGSAAMNIDADSSVIVQAGNQYNAKINYEADYEEVPYNLSKGTTASGIVAFPTIADGEFEYVIEMHSDNFDERFETVTFKINKETSSVFVPAIEPNAVWSFEDLKYETKGYTIQIERVEFYDNETRIHLVATNDGKAVFSVDADGSVIIQNKKQFNTESMYDVEYDELPYSIAKGATATGAISFPVVDSAEFEYTIEIHSDDYDEEFENVVFVINADSPFCKNNQENDVKQENNITTPSRNQLAVEKANAYFDANPEYPFTPDDYRWELKNEGFTDTEVEYALEKCKVNWYERAVFCAKGYGQGYEETIYHLTQVQGFSMEQAIYGADNMN